MFLLIKILQKICIKLQILDNKSIEEKVLDLLNSNIVLQKQNYLINYIELYSSYNDLIKHMKA